MIPYKLYKDKITAISGALSLMQINVNKIYFDLCQRFGQILRRFGISLLIQIKNRMIIKSEQTDFEELLAVINDGASAYRGIIPSDRWHDPYMTAAELKKQIGDGVQFWIYRQDDEIMGVMGIQYRNSVTLIRHAYVRTKDRKKGIGSKLLKQLCDLTDNPILIGTWAHAKWAIEFYQKHGFRLLPEGEKNKLLRKFWTIPVRQIETSVVLASADWVGE